MNKLDQLDLSSNYYFINQVLNLKLVGCEGSFGSALIAAYPLEEELQPQCFEGSKGLQPKKLVGHTR